MHRLIALRAGIDASLEIDHIDRDSLNNTRANLRSASRQLNQANIAPSAANRSGYKGVSWKAGRNGAGAWYASIGAGGHDRHLGRFATAEEAALLNIIPDAR